MELKARKSKLEMILFTLIAVILYAVADGIVKALEKRKGELLNNRSLIFFAIITILALVTFNLLQIYGPEFGLFPSEPVQKTTP